MVVKEYQFWGQYKIPAGASIYNTVDGLYIDGDLFSNNMPVRDGIIHLVVTPQSANLIDKRINISIPIYKDGKVSTIGHEFHWYPGTISTLTYDIDYEGYPYGMGLNLIAIWMLAYPIAIRNIWFKVLYQFHLEVG